jgi:hypothetical protein
VTPPVRGEFRERSAEPRTRSVPLAHLSVELGHLYMEDFVAGPDRLERLFADVAPWAQAAASSVRTEKTARVSTCFLVDDYFSQLQSPAEVMPQVLAAAKQTGVTIDYLAREAACARTTGPVGDLSPAELLVAQLVEEPEPGATGGRPAAAQTGWLCNGRRSPVPNDASAMEVLTWSPPEQSAARRHSIFVDVELWDGDGPDRTWSCPLLAAVWQALRLGLLRRNGEALVEPVDPPDTWPRAWAELPAVVRLNPAAAPFAAYGTLSILPSRFLPVEIAVRTILGQTWFDPAVTEQLSQRARGERLEHPEEILDRIAYVFAGAAVVDPA